MAATALKKVLISLFILIIIMIVEIIIIQRKKDLTKLQLTIIGSLTSGLIITLCIGLAEMDWNIIWDLFRNLKIFK